MGIPRSTGATIVGLALALAAMGCSSETEPPTPAPEVCGPGQAPDPVGGSCCAAGTLPLPEGGCRPAGIQPEQCGEGFSPDDQGGCFAVLPGEDCAPGAMAAIGETSCREVAPCGPEPWGDIPVESGTQHVDTAYAGADSDGTASRPWTRIQPAIDAAAPGAIIAVAAGTYEEDLLIIGKPVRLWGRCPSLVEVRSTPAAPLATIEVSTLAGRTEIRDLAVTGSNTGVFVGGSTEVLIDRVWVHDTAFRGIGIESVRGLTSVTVRGSLIESAHDGGVFVSGASVQVEDTVVRGTLPNGQGRFGRGFMIQPLPASSSRPSASLRGVVIANNTEVGVNVNGADALIERSVVSGTVPNGLGELGRGLSVERDVPTGERANATIRSSSIRANHELGIFTIGSELLIEATVVRDTLADAQNRYGRGVVALNSLSPVVRSDLTVLGSLISNNRDVAVLVAGSDALIEGTLIRDTQLNSLQERGRAINIQPHPDNLERSNVTVRGCSIENSHDLGICVASSEAVIEMTAVRQTAPEGDGSFGDGIAVIAGAAEAAIATISTCHVANSTRAGISSFGGNVAMGTTAITCQAFALDAEENQGFVPSFENLGENGCGCPAPTGECQLLTSGLAPPEPHEP